jgi:FdrA protein
VSSGLPTPPDGETYRPTTIAEGVAELRGANLVLISTPGPYATAEALKALKAGLHVFLFSDNVPLEDEIELKRIARSKRLLLMGPDCGTAILDGVPLGFANAVRRGDIGLIGATGTGLQQVTALIDRAGGGVSQAIGVGGRDLDQRVGGVMMLAALERLASDDSTKVIVLLSKPPAPLVAARVLGAARLTGKPIVVNFLGTDPEVLRPTGAMPAVTLEDAAEMAVALSRGDPTVPSDSGLAEDELTAVRAQTDPLLPEQREIRGLYSGGSLADEAKIVLKNEVGPVAAAHEVIDLGGDEFTRGRPHPLIDPRLRGEHIVAAARESTVAVILLDVVLGYGAHPDPGGALVPAIEEAREAARNAGRHLAIVASVCGTERDPQGLVQQEARLADAGVLLARSNARATRLAAAIISREARRA